MPTPTLTPQQVLADPRFHQLPLGEQLKVMRTVDPNFAALPAKDQGTVLYKAKEQFTFPDGLPGEPKKDEGFWNRLGSNLLAIPGGMVDTVLHPQQTADSMIDEAVGLQDKAAQAYRGGHPVEAAGYGISSMIPFIGPMMARAGESIGEGRYGEGLGDVATLTGPSALRAISEVPRVAHAQDVGMRVVKGGASTAIQGVIDRPWRSMFGFPVVADAIRGAAEGYRNAPEFGDVLHKSAPIEYTKPNYKPGPIVERRDTGILPRDVMEKRPSVLPLNPRELVQIQPIEPPRPAAAPPPLLARPTTPVRDTGIIPRELMERRVSIIPEPIKPRELVQIKPIEAAPAPAPPKQPAAPPVRKTSSGRILTPDELAFENAPRERRVSTIPDIPEIVEPAVQAAQPTHPAAMPSTSPIAPITPGPNGIMAPSGSVIVPPKEGMHPRYGELGSQFGAQRAEAAMAKDIKIAEYLKKKGVTKQQVLDATPEQRKVWAKEAGKYRGIDRVDDLLRLLE